MRFWCLDRTIEYSTNSLSFVQGIRERLWENEVFPFTTGMEFPNGMKLTFFREVVS